MLTHRWLGVGLCILFVAWFFSGIVMMYWRFPRVEIDERLSAAYDPEVIVLLGQPFLALIDQVQKHAAKLVPWALEIRPSQIGDRASLQGAIIAALSTAYETISRSFHSDTGEYLTDHLQDHRTAEANA